MSRQVLWMQRCGHDWGLQHTPCMARPPDWHKYCAGGTLPSWCPRPGLLLSQTALHLEAAHHSVQLPLSNAVHLATDLLVHTPAAAVPCTAHKQGKALSRLSRMTAPEGATPGVAAGAPLPGAPAQTPAAKAGSPDGSVALAAGLFATPQAASRSQVGTILVLGWVEQVTTASKPGSSLLAQSVQVV